MVLCPRTSKAFKTFIMGWWANMSLPRVNVVIVNFNFTRSWTFASKEYYRSQPVPRHSNSAFRYGVEFETPWNLNYNKFMCVIFQQTIEHFQVGTCKSTHLIEWERGTQFNPNIPQQDMYELKIQYKSEKTLATFCHPTKGYCFCGTFLSNSSSSLVLKTRVLFRWGTFGCVNSIPSKSVSWRVNCCSNACTTESTKNWQEGKWSFKRQMKSECCRACNIDFQFIKTQKRTRERYTLSTMWWCKQQAIQILKKHHLQVDMQGLALDGSSKPSESLGNPTRMRCGEGTGPWW